jgi:hypothetical protein
VSVREAVAPYTMVAEQEAKQQGVAEISDRVHALLVQQAARVAEDGGESMPALEALKALAAAHKHMERAVDALTEQRATELWFAAQCGQDAS